MSVRRFHSGLLPFMVPKPKGFPYHGKGFSYRLVSHDPKGYYAEMKHVTRRKKLPGYEYPKEIIVEALTEEAARRGHDLLWASLVVVQGGQFYMDLHDVEQTMIEDSVLKENPKTEGRSTLNTSGIVEAAELAIKVSFRRSATYAISKYHFSSSLCSVHLVDLDPYFATDTFRKLKRPINQVQAAASIVQAYGAIEELGLEVRASAKRPSSLPDGTWNPEVKQDLEARLRKSGVDIADTFNWQIRGNKTNLEKNKPRQIHHTSTPSPWARWTVRDRMVEVVDAIAHLSWLRSHVSSHRMKASQAHLLTVYDVTNGQFLARRLILESLGFWKRWKREAEERDE